MRHDNLLEIASFSPRSMKFPNSWLGHLPFAVWVIQKISPNIFVELGTHSGNSYFSFCQSVVERGISTKCYAVDTWKGDEHAGQYSDEVFAEVNTHNQEHYSGFSRLLRMTFDEAVSYFSDGSIELLHIDGLHTYEAVRHDFETWLPKLAPGAVIMFHDINVREGDFGVWMLWEELKTRYLNHMEFIHSHGLGVLQLNNVPDDGILAWLLPESPDKQGLIKYFTALGSRQLERFDSSQVIAAHKSEVADLKQHAANLGQVIADLKQHAANLGQVIEANESLVADLQKNLSDKDKQIDHLNCAVERAEFLEGQLTESEQKMDELLSSTSWRITEPLRILRNLLKQRSQPNDYSVPTQDEKQKIIPQDTDSGKQDNALLPEDCNFDAEFYQKAYPDTYGLEPYFHYLNYGKDEGRLPCPPPFPIESEKIQSLDKDKENILIVSHEASRTGAPILALNIAKHFKEKKYNVIVFLLGGGDLLADFQEHCDIVVEAFPLEHSSFSISILLEQLISRVWLKFALVNSVVSRSALPILARHFVPSLCLIHEFASYTHPKNAIRDVAFWASQVVFSARIVYENNLTQCDALKRYGQVILPQGKCIVPQAKNTEKADENEKHRIRKLFRPDNFSDDTVVILGAGSVHIRKGVDLFLACATRVVGLRPQNPFRFVWVGSGFDPDLDLVYSVYLQDQIKRAGLEDHMCFTGEISDIDMAYELSDVLLLSSRLDPLPNVAIDAMFKQLPVICFDKTTGIADLLKEYGLGEACVIPYLDIEQAAQCIVTLIDNSDQRMRLGKEIYEIGKKLFDMRTYVDSLERQAMDCVAMQDAEKSDCALIEEDGTLDLDFFSSPSWSALTYNEAVRVFVRSWNTGIDMRKPFPGFHPGIYGDSHGLSQMRINPLASFIKAGKPEGPWLYDLIQPSHLLRTSDNHALRSALHIHVFFEDLFLDILQRLDGQNLPLDLLISVPSLEVARNIRSMVRDYSYGIIDIRIVPNRGRDIGPLLTEFSEIILRNYDVIGHIHTKKSGDVKDLTMGKYWYKYLLENLIGGNHPMASIILNRMSLNEKLGIVFPDDPYVVGWSANKEIAEVLAHQLGISNLPDGHFNFPVGTMFWARTLALKPLLTKGFTWEYYPEEPLLYDGTVLHALERILPFVVKNMGYQDIMTHVPGVTR